MSALLTSPHNLDRGDPIRAKVKAYNSRGWSGISDPSDIGPLVQTVPDQMSPPSRSSTSSMS